MQRLYSSSDIAAEACRRGDRLTPDAVRLAARVGRLTATATTGTGQRLYSADAVERYLRARAAQRGQRS